jgi:hypothetical protein
LLSQHHQELAIADLLPYAPRLGWEFGFLVPISGTPIGSGIPIPFLIPVILAELFLEFRCSKIVKSEFRFQNFGIP